MKTLTAILLSSTLTFTPAVFAEDGRNAAALLGVGTWWAMKKIDDHQQAKIQEEKRQREEQARIMNQQYGDYPYNTPELYSERCYDDPAVCAYERGARIRREREEKERIRRAYQCGLTGRCADDLMPTTRGY